MRDPVVPFLIVFGSILLTGCGPGPKWVNTINAESKVTISSRYVTASKSIKVQAKDLGLKIDLVLPASIPRVSPTKLENTAKSFKFDSEILSKYEDWLKRLSAATSQDTTTQCEDLALDFPAAQETVDGLTKVLNVRFAQDASGTLSITLTASKSKDLIVMLRTTPITSVFKCVSEWADSETLKQYPQLLLKFREAYVESLLNAASFDSSKTGNRLSRKSLAVEGQDQPGNVARSEEKRERTDKSNKNQQDQKDTSIEPESSDEKKGEEEQNLKEENKLDDHEREEQRPHVSEKQQSDLLNEEEAKSSFTAEDESNTEKRVRKSSK